MRPTAQRREALNYPLRPGVKLHFGDMLDFESLLNIHGSIEGVDEIYHLAAQSHVGVSFKTPYLTSDTNALGTLRLLEAIRILGLGKKVRIYSVRIKDYLPRY